MSKKFRGMDPYTGEPGPIVLPKTNLHKEIDRLREEVEGLYARCRFQQIDIAKLNDQLTAAEKVVEAARRLLDWLDSTLTGRSQKRHDMINALDAYDASKEE